MFDLLPFYLTVWISVLSLFAGGLVWMILGYMALRDGRKRESIHSWREPKWEYVVAAMLFSAGSLFTAGAIQIHYDPTGLVDGFALISVLFALLSGYAFYRWVGRRF